MSALRSQPGRKPRPEAVLRRGADGRFGVFTYVDAIAAGLSAGQLGSRVRAGVVDRLLPRTYRFNGYPDSWEQRAMAAQVWAGSGAALSGATAAAIWGIDIDSYTTEITTTKGQASPRHDIRVRRTKAWRKFETVTHGVFVVTHITRTLMDLAGREDPETAEVALNVALHRKLTTVERLTRYADSVPRGTRGLAQLRAHLGRLEEEKGVPTNRFETKFLRLLRSARLPLPQAQYQVIRPGGRRTYIDFAYPHAMVAIETDGYETHGDYNAWASDRARRNDLEAWGWRVIQITYRQLCEGPSEVIALIRALLQPPLVRRV